MERNNIMIGNWVEFPNQKFKGVLLGYVISINKDETYVHVPKNNRTYRLHKNLLTCRENIELHSQDVQILIDLALDQRDFSWLSTLVTSYHSEKKIKQFR